MSRPKKTPAISERITMLQVTIWKLRQAEPVAVVERMPSHA